MYFFYNLIFSLLFPLFLFELLKFPFKSRFIKNNMNKSNVMQMLINNNIITNISIGSNSQLIEMNIKLQKYSTFILS